LKTLVENIQKTRIFSFFCFVFMSTMTIFDFLHIIAGDVLLFGWALLVMFFCVLVIYILITIIKINRLVDNFNSSFIHFREGMQKLLDPLLIFVGMLKNSIEINKSPKVKSKVKPKNKSIKKKPSTTKNSIKNKKTIKIKKTTK